MIEVSVVGGGSWATALVKILTENKIPTNWYLRRNEQVKHIKEKGSNPSYLPQVRLNPLFIFPSDNLLEVIERGQIVIFAVPSAAIQAVCNELDSSLFTNKMVLSAMKGTVGANNEVPSSFISRILNIPATQIATIAGPCHSEEIAASKLTYLSLSCTNQDTVDRLSVLFRRPYIKVCGNDDPMGVGYASIYKNVLGIASGMATGLGYGDNFMAVLVSNALFEMQNILASTPAEQREMLNSTYAGDLLVTGYSNNSRNRRFGELIAQGHSAEIAVNKLGMVAEGYHATQGLFGYANEKELNLPILTTVYRILFGKESIETGFKKLEEKLI
ncbi:NAD(P)H-dependent glycerol-3-phosphate dehydrogenase [Sphingobacterium humi]|uniref:Glycerol-3-phosphate dehydrogenase n=1 Tax=Sphingobacterium humi TaxID=1796905 RepID=A0A6N8L3L7_9SPHI|nr:NAD(P)H-dependent glycerol-3-phosphate dehydrogenase [Sphingobacterium humi]MVZ63619.1 glycerol-3-phosphate dehydrogenase [Sphingobacterium humi]